ncbi:MAG: FKBP-type peptidyl-prolyl cis-trans isomerase [Nitrospiraceae bacterium]|nr:FKBP-type peptidyl-prolyl cis-trans isomerase [Nitrospiraceae bacterium]
MAIRIIVILFFLAICSPAQAGEPAQLKTKQDRVSYSAGYDMAVKIKESGVPVDPDIVIRAVTDVLKGRPTLMTEKEVNEVISHFREERKAELSEKNKREGEEFLAANAKKEGIVVLPSGLQYKIVKPGSGRTPLSTDLVRVHYRGTLIDGAEFDNSRKRGQPVLFAVNQAIKGWGEALMLMKEGATWQLFIPAGLAYGDRGIPGSPIGPDAALIYEIELLSVMPQAQDGSQEKKP